MTNFEPWISPEVLAELGFGRQIYPLSSTPYGLGGNHKSPMNLRQVKARPHDPNSPFIWGGYALMMVCGGHWDRAATNKAVQAARGTKPRKAVQKDSYTGETTIVMEPAAAFSTLSTTGKLLTNMADRGFTTDEAVSTFERYSSAGGAYWHFMHSFGSGEETLEKLERDWFNSRTREVLDEETGVVTKESTFSPSPISITPAMNPWGNWWDISKSYINSSLTRTPMAVHVRDELDIPTPTPPTITFNNTSTGRETEIRRGLVKTILSEIHLQTRSMDPAATPSRYITGSDDDPRRISTTNTLKDSGKFKFRWADGVLREGYLPWLVESGVLEEHTDIRKAVKGKGRTPDRGFCFSPMYDDKEAMETFWSQWGTPAPAPAPEAVESQPEPVDTTPINLQDFFDMTGGEAA